MSMKKGSGSKLGGIATENIPPSKEKVGSTKLYTPSAGLTKSSPLTGAPDSRPRSGDNKPGATRGGGKSGGSSAGGSTRVKNVY